MGEIYLPRKERFGLWIWSFSRASPGRDKTDLKVNVLPGFAAVVPFATHTSGQIVLKQLFRLDFSSFFFSRGVVLPGQLTSQTPPIIQWDFAVGPTLGRGWLSSEYLLLCLSFSNRITHFRRYFSDRNTGIFMLHEAPNFSTTLL